MEEDNRIGCELLVGLIGVRVTNMIMTPSTFARLAAVSTDVWKTAHDIYAWEGLEIHLEHHDIRIRELVRMSRIWKLSDALYLDYYEAASLDDHDRLMSSSCPSAAHDRRCPIAAVWRFLEIEMRAPPELEEDPVEDYDLFEASFLHLSTAVFPSGQYVFFDMEFPTHNMPCFDVGWMCDDHDIWKHLCFRVVPQGVPIFPPESDRARWYAGDAMSGDPAIRVPSSWTRTSPRSRLIIGLKFTDTRMTISINTGHWEAVIEPQFRRGWSRRKHRPAILVLNDSNPESTWIKPQPWLMNRESSLRLAR